LQKQTQAPDQILVCYTTPADIGGLHSDNGVVLIQSAPGLPRQRNAILDRVTKCDVVLFLDDDFIVDHRYVETVARIFAQHADVVVATGVPYADDVKGPGLSVADARRLIADADESAIDLSYIPAPHGYGCNMAIRFATAAAHGIRFDERLPLYGWSEDIDYTHRLGRFGRMVKLAGARGVHLGAKSGRSSGKRLGYSQVANPLYLRGKGSYSWRRAAGSVGRNLAANLVRALRPEPYIDRRGRLLGNMLAFADLCTGRLQPERILEMK
jgi:GT2 family glycosyltransferase